MRIITATIVAVLFYGLVFFWYDIILFTEGSSQLYLFALTAVLYIIIVVNFLRCITRLAFIKDIDKGKAKRPLIVYTLILLMFHLNLINSSEVFRSPVAENACYEGTMNRAVLKLRINKTFEIGQSGFFSYTISQARIQNPQILLFLILRVKKMNTQANTLIL
jgi:hypothetical protein